MFRRRFLAASLAAVACSRKKTSGFRGFAFVANAEGRSIAVVDLQTFLAVKHLRLNASPEIVAAHGYKPVVFALTPANGQIHRIDVSSLAVEATRSFTRTATTMRVTQSGDAAWLLAAQERKLIRVNFDTMTPDSMIGLPEGATDFELSPESPHAIVQLGGKGRFAIIDLAQRRVAYETSVGTRTGPVRFLKNGKLLLAGNRDNRTLVILEARTGQPVIELPLSLEPERFCFKQDGGQLFVTGSGADAVAVIYPFQTQVAGTILAGHAPGSMAASANPDLLFVANPDAGVVTVLDIQTQKVRAAVNVGKRPEGIVITPDQNFALVLNRESGDLAVLRVDAMAGRRTKAAPLFTMIPVGSGPVAAVAIAV